LDAKELAAKLLDETTHHTGKITVSDVDRGFKDVSLDYRRGSPPSGYPSNIRLYAPGNRITWKIMGADGVLDDPTRLLLACMPKDRSNTDFLDLLTPPCYRVLVEIAIGLVFGFPRMERKK
jgi:hypothetical protein